MLLGSCQGSRCGAELALPGQLHRPFLRCRACSLPAPPTHAAAGGFRQSCGLSLEGWVRTKKGLRSFLKAAVNAQNINRPCGDSDESCMGKRPLREMALCSISLRPAGWHAGISLTLIKTGSEAAVTKLADIVLPHAPFLVTFEQMRLRLDGLANASSRKLPLTPADLTTHPKCSNVEQVPHA